MSESAYVAIGNRASTAPVPHSLSSDDWLAFRHALRSVVEELGGSTFSVSDGVGFWQGEEESTYVLGFSPPSDGPAFWRALRPYLSAFAYHYQQECISVVCGEPEYVPALATVTIDGIELTDDSR